MTNGGVTTTSGRGLFTSGGGMMTRGPCEQIRGLTLEACRRKRGAFAWTCDHPFLQRCHSASEGVNLSFPNSTANEDENDISTNTNTGVSDASGSASGSTSGSASRSLPPCRVDQTEGCVPRVKDCGSHSPDTYDHRIKQGKNTDCGSNGHIDPHGNDGRYLVQFTGSDGSCHEIVMRVGECWGKNPNNGGTYNCNGRCGPSCGNGRTCSNWAYDCLVHDACSWYYSSKGGRFDSHCGDEVATAQDDYASWCMWPRKGKCEESPDIGCGT